MEIAAGDIRRLDPDDIVAQGRALTGLSDMGEPDILPAMRLLIDAYINEAHLAPRGVEAQRAALINVVANRLRITDTFKRHPEILQEKIHSPIIITGLARSGTTKLQRMIAADTRLQKLPLWRILNPMPSGVVPPGDEDPRIAMTEQLSAMMRDHFPDFYAGHPMNAREPDEEMLMAELTMRGSFPCHALRIPSFDKWLRQQDHGTWYEFLFRMLQMFQWQDGSPQKRWLLKAPAHLGYITSLFLMPRSSPAIVIRRRRRLRLPNCLARADACTAISTTRGNWAVLNWPHGDGK
jgi:Sulfotransferase family